MSPTWLEWFRAVYPVILTLISAVGFVAILWLSSKYLTRVKYDADGALHDEKHQLISRTLEKHETRLAVLEEHAEASPTRQELQDDIAQIAQRMSGVEASVRGMSSELRSTNQLIHTLIDKAIPGSGERR